MEEGFYNHKMEQCFHSLVINSNFNQIAYRIPGKETCDSESGKIVKKWLYQKLP